MGKYTNRSLLILVSLAILSSCKEEKVNRYFAEKTIQYELDFPDAVYRNKLYDGKIKYTSALDTIITTFGDKRKNRYTRFIMLKTNTVDYDFNHLKKVAIDSFGALDNRTIPFYDIKFPEAGVYYIDGIINDIVTIDTVSNSGKVKEDYLVRFIEMKPVLHIR